MVVHMHNASMWEEEECQLQGQHGLYSETLSEKKKSILTNDDYKLDNFHSIAWLKQSLKLSSVTVTCYWLLNVNW